MVTAGRGFALRCGAGPYARCTNTNGVGWDTRTRNVGCGAEAASGFFDFRQQRNFFGESGKQRDICDKRFADCRALHECDCPHVFRAAGADFVFVFGIERYAGLGDGDVNADNFHDGACFRFAGAAKAAGFASGHVVMACVVTRVVGRHNRGEKFGEKRGGCVHVRRAGYLLRGGARGVQRGKPNTERARNAGGKLQRHSDGKFQ
jgi:hypothetical protein